MRTVLPTGSEAGNRLSAIVCPMMQTFGRRVNVALGEETAPGNLPIAHGQIQGIDADIFIRVAIQVPGHRSGRC